MMMQPEQGIGRELSLGEVISKTFEVYRRDFAKYFVLFAVVGVIVQAVTTLAQQAFVLPILPVNPTPQQFSTWFSALFAAFFLLIAVIFVVNIVFSTIAEGSAVKLGIMFSLALPVLLIENKGVTESMGRSRELVGKIWLKTFASFLVLGIILLVASFIVSAISGSLGILGPVVNGILSALYQPLFPILMAVYYYSNLARISQPPPGQMPMGPTATFQAGIKLCPTCGTQNVSSATFCTKCGAR